MANTRDDFGRRIELIRKKKNISQEDLAVKAGITRNNLSRIENGKYSAGMDILQRIADALDMELGFTEAPH